MRALQQFRARTVKCAVLLACVAIQAAYGQNLSVNTYSEYTIYEPSPEVTLVPCVVIVEAPPIAVPTDRAPVGLVAVLDRSGSMYGDPIDLVKRSAEFLASSMTSSDRFGIVSYASDVSVDLPLAFGADGADEAINQMEADGNTNLSGGVVEGVTQLADADLGSSVPQSVFLFSDGQANEGTTDADAIVDEIFDAAQGADVRVSTFAFGSADYFFMETIARRTEGTAYVVESDDDIPRLFGQALGGLLTTYAQNIRVRLVPADGCVITDLRTSGRVVSGSSGSAGAIEIVFADLFAEERRDIYCELDVPPTQLGGSVLEAAVEYTPAASDATRSADATLEVQQGTRPSDARPSPEVELAQLRFRTADALQAAATSSDYTASEQQLAAVRGDVAAFEPANDAQTSEQSSLLSSLDDAITETQSGEVDATNLSSASASYATQRSTGCANCAQGTSAQQDTAAASVAFAGMRGRHGSADDPTDVLGMSGGSEPGYGSEDSAEVMYGTYGFYGGYGY